jgi:hypothetical protein
MNLAKNDNLPSIALQSGMEILTIIKLIMDREDLPVAMFFSLSAFRVKD